MSRKYWFLLLIPVSYFLLTLAFFWFYLRYDTPDILQFLGAALTVVAYAFWLIARIQLGNAFSINPRAKILMQHGFYAKLRHPIYLFQVIVVIGLALVLRSWLVALLAVFLGTLQSYRARREEGVLETQFGQEYQRYRQRTWF